MPTPPDDADTPTRSGWIGRESTDVSLREYIAEQFAAHAREHEADQKAVITAIAAVDRERIIHAEAHSRAHTAHDKEHTLERQALDKADESMNLRLEAMNEFRDALRDQAATLIRKETLEAFEASTDKRFDASATDRSQLREQAQTFVRKDALDAFGTSISSRFDELSKLVATEREERRANEGIKRGMGQTTTIIVAAIGLVGTVLGIVIILANVFTAVPK